MPGPDGVCHTGLGPSCCVWGLAAHLSPDALLLLKAQLARCATLRACAQHVPAHPLPLLGVRTMSLYSLPAMLG